MNRIECILNFFTIDVCCPCMVCAYTSPRVTYLANHNCTADYDIEFNSNVNEFYYLRVSRCIILMYVILKSYNLYSCISYGHGYIFTRPPNCAKIQTRLRLLKLEAFIQVRSIIFNTDNSPMLYGTVRDF